MSARDVGSTILMGLSWLCRLLAIAFALCTLALCFSWVFNLGFVADTIYLLSQLLPPQISGLFVLMSPFGGTFRGDFALSSLALFIADWVFMRLAAKVG